MNPSEIQAHADELYSALRQSRCVAPLSTRVPSITIDDAYYISRALLERRRGGCCR